MSEIHLTASVRNNLLSLERMNKQLSQTTERLTTEKKINRASDDPAAYYASKNLEWASDSMDTRLDGMSESASLISSADNGISSIQSYVTQMQGLIDDALSNTDSDARRQLGVEFNTLITQIRDTTQDSAYDGVNLLYNNDKDTVRFNDNGSSSVTLEGVNISAAAGDPDENGEIGASGVSRGYVATDTLGNTSMEYSSYALTFDMDGESFVGIKSAGTDGGSHEIDWGDDDYQDLLTSLEADLEKFNTGLETESTLLATDISIITMRQDFTESKQTIYDDGAEKLVACDLNEEAANALSLQTSESLAVSCLSSASRMGQQALTVLES
jgi:flagellin